MVSTNAVPQPARSKETQVVLGGLWRPSPGLALQLSVPVRHLSASGSESVSYTELGDPEFSVSGIFCHKRNLMAVTFSLLLGLADDDLRNADGDRVDPSLQPGRGATSPGVRALVSRQLSDTYTLFIAGGIRLEAEDTRAGYRWGNRFDASAGVQARLDAFEVGGTLSRVTVAQSSRDGGTIDNTGSSTTHLIPYVRWNINDRFALTLADQVLLAADVKGEQRLPAHMISAGATIAF
ncbi:MAG: hypothetical protein QGH29_12515 [Kiritimatiellia bacterium]|nr:hypothetical protein [Kiritimatiellia bacterium]MDP6810471.1 hypothetical protein [Kiritimatiellia bacterium]